MGDTLQSVDAGRPGPYALGGMARPGKPAIIAGLSGACITYGELDPLVNRRAHAFRACGMSNGDAVAICIDNSPEFLITALGALRSGLVVVPISTLLTASEIAFILDDCGARMLIVSPAIGDTMRRLAEEADLPRHFCVGPARDGYRSWTDLCGAQPAGPIADEAKGGEILYSSGTTGRPKGIVYHGVAGEEYRGVTDAILGVAARMGVTNDRVYLSPAPLYHSAPFAWSIGVLQMGGTVVIMEKFDAEHALALIERHRVDTAQFVPTHFVRMLKLPADRRERYDMSSLRLAIHSAAPCPVEVKQAMIDWWGPILLEYFGSSEQIALTIINSRDWLAHPGSVGRCVLGRLHICDENGEPVPPGTIGTIHSEGGMAFSYRGDDARTRASRNRHGWTTVGDVGYLDEEGFLYLADRGAFMIITGGVNVYPQEIENLLVTHPEVVDAAVVGVPDAEMGEIVTAVVQPVEMARATAEFAVELRSWLRQRLSGAKTPRRIEFRAQLPRLPTGKMKKHLLLADLADAGAEAAPGT